MSLILDALKKVEKDRSRRDPKAAADIASAIVLSDHDTNRRRMMLIGTSLFLAAILVFAAGAGITYFMAGSGQPLKKGGPQPLPSEPSSLKSNASGPSTTLTAKPSEPVLAAIIREPSEANRAIIRNRAAKQTLPARKAEKSPAVSTPPVQKGIPTEASRTTAQEDPPTMKISGIVWFEDRHDRRALINGISLKEGDTVEGARIVQIDPTLVHFTRNGRAFEISMEQK